MYTVEEVESLAFIGTPYLYEDLCNIYPLTVGDLLALQKKYDIYLRLLTMDKNFIAKIFLDRKLEVEVLPTPLDYLLNCCKLDDNFLLELEKGFSTFIKEEVTILCDLKQIVIGEPEEKRFLNESNFRNFQDILRLQNKIKTEFIPENESEKARYFREKREFRDEVKRKQESAKAPSFSNLLSALCTYGIGITPFNIKDLSIYSFYSLVSSNRNKERYDIEMHYLYAGADPKKLNPKYWITNS